MPTTETTAAALFTTHDLVQHTGPMPVIWSYGMGAESTAAVHRWLGDPTSRPPELLPDLSNLIVLTAQTGDEWSATIAAVEHHLLPELRYRRIRFVEVARAGPTQADGVRVLQDTREPWRLHADPDEHGFFSLSEENRRGGVMPQLGGRRLCSAKAKGFPLDRWRELELGDRPYLHAVGFNIDEGKRIAKDEAVTLGGRRIPIYPVHDWGWTRQDCLDYLRRPDVFGPDCAIGKSCCRECPYPNKDGWREQLERFRTLPAEAAPHLVDEQVTLALNKDSGLFGPGKSLNDRLRADGAIAVVDLASIRFHTAEWALYRVRRIFTGRAAAWRSVEIILTGASITVRAALVRLARHLGSPLHSLGDGIPRLWLAERDPDAYPTVEEFYVATAAQARNKQRPGFETRWAGFATDDLIAMEDAAAEFTTRLSTQATTTAA